MAKQKSKPTVKKTEVKESQGLGDTLEKVFEATGISKLVKFIAGEDCGCEERKEKLNKIFPYHKPLCLTEDEYTWLDAYVKSKKNTLDINEQQVILKMYNRIMRDTKKPTSCADCWRDIWIQLKKVYDTYENTND